MTPLGKSKFTFSCHPDISCFTHCCRKLDLFLYPYDILKLKKRLGITSDVFLERHAGVVKGLNPHFPSVMLQMAANEERTCPFLDANGCTVYEDRPSSCRMYPLERAVDRTSDGNRPEEFYFLTSHPYCKGHEEDKEWTVKEWVRDQNLLYYNAMDDLWTEMDTIFSKNPWQGEGHAGPMQRLAFMACYNIDGFREYVNTHDLLSRFRLDKARKRDIKTDDEALLKFGYDWLKLVLTGNPTLQAK